MIVPCSDGGVNSGPSVKPLHGLDGLRADLRREVDQVVERRRPDIRTAAACVGNGCVGAARSPGTSDGGTGRSSIGQTGSPVTRSNVYTKPCLVICATALTRCRRP